MLNSLKWALIQSQLKIVVAIVPNSLDFELGPLALSTAAPFICYNREIIVG